MKDFLTVQKFAESSLTSHTLLSLSFLSRSLPAVFFSLCLALMVASLLESILITNLLSGSADFSPVPHWIRVFVLQILGFLVCLPQKTEGLKASGMQFICSSAVINYVYKIKKYKITENCTINRVAWMD